MNRASSSSVVNMSDRRGSTTAYIVGWVQDHRSVILTGSSKRSFDERIAMLRDEPVLRDKRLRAVGIENMPSVEFVEQAIRARVSESDFVRKTTGNEARYEVTHTNPGFVLDVLAPGGVLLMLIIELAKRQRDILLASRRSTELALSDAVLRTHDGFESNRHYLFRYFDDI